MPLEDVVGHGGDDRVVASRLPAGSNARGSWPRRNEPGAPAVTVEAVGALGDPRRGPVDQHAPAAAPRSASRSSSNSGSQRAARVAEQLLARLLALELAAHRQLAPQPRHRDVVGAVAELAAQQRAPDLLVRLLRPSRARIQSRAVIALERRRPRARPRCSLQHREAHAHARRRRQRAEAQQVQRAGERPRAALEEERHATTAATRARRASRARRRARRCGGRW